MKKLFTLLFFCFLLVQGFSQVYPDFKIGIHNTNSTSLEAKPVGGTSPFTYIWSTGETTQTINIIDSTTYCVTVTDSDGKIAGACIINPSYCNLQIVQIGNELQGATTGYPPFSYTWYRDGEQISTSETITSQPGYGYCLEIIDSEGCKRVQCVGTCPSMFVKLNDTMLINVSTSTQQPILSRWLSSFGEVLGFTDTLKINLADYEACGIGVEDTVQWANGHCHFEPLQYGGLFTSKINTDTSQSIIKALPEGGIPPFAYLWNNGETTSAISFLPQNQYCVTITDATGQTATSCKEINAYIGSLYFSEQIQIDQFIQDHPTVTTVEGNIVINNWQNLMTNIDGLSNIKKVIGNFYLAKIENLNGISNLEYVGGDLTIRYTTETNLTVLAKLTTVKKQLRIANNDFITSLDGLDNLSEVGRLNISLNLLLTNIDALAGLTSCYDIAIDYNPKLTNLNGISNIASIQCGLHIEHNATLSTCELCNLLDFTGNFSITDNASGCQTFDDIACGNVISGTVYYDFNQNQQQDSFEAGLPNQKVWISNPGYYVYTDNYGKYYHYASAGTYTIAWNPNSDWQLTTSPNEYTIIFINGSPSIHNDFGIYPTSQQHDFSSNITSSLTRCNEDVNFYLSISNDGTYNESGHVSLNYEPNITYVAAYPPPTSLDQTNHTMSWNYDNLYPWQTENFTIIFHMPSSQIAYLNDTMYWDSTGTDIVVDETGFSSPIECSFDPNDKQVTPAGLNDEHLTLKNQNLTYTIRFQNTGNSYAKDVVIRDTLDPNLDWNTFRVRNFSHKVQSSISPEGLVTFTFKNIYLVDSTESYNASQGFVTYSISPKENLPENTVINNTAHIYFDFNPAIITNTTTNTLVTQLPVATSNIPNPVSFALYPNPTSDKFHILLDKNNGRQVLVLETTDLAGKTITLQPINNQRVTTISADHLPKGMYFISLKDKETGAILHTEKLVIE